MYDAGNSGEQGGVMKVTLAILAIFTACVSVVFAGEGKPLPADVFGITVGVPISIPQCVSDNGVGTEKECWYRNSYTATGSVEVATPLNAPLPAWVRDISVQIIDEKVEGVQVYTMGSKVQQDVLHALVAKYGKPTELGHKDMQTLGGATFQSVSAYWQSESIAILFSGVDDSINNGVVRIVTPKWLAHMREIGSGANETQM